MPVRGSSIQSFSTSSVNVTWPSGTQAGDLAIVLWETAYNTSNPSGWTNIFLHNGSVANGVVAYKVLSSGDISTGFVTLGASGAYANVACIVTMIGAPTFREAPSIRWAGAVPVTLTTSSAVAAGDVALYIAGARANQTMVPDRGSVLQTQTVSEQSACIYIEAISASGAYSVNFNMGSTESGVIASAVILIDTIGVETRLVTDSISLSDSTANDVTGGISNTILVDDDTLSLSDLAVANFAVKFPPSLRGNIDYDQIRADARSGPGEKLLTTTGTNTAGHSSVFDSDGNLIDSGSAPGGSGTVTSVAQTVPSGFSVTGSPVTTSGTLAITLDSQAANKFLASPDGSSGSPTFRVIAAGDLPLGSSSAFGAVKVDNTTITAAAGIISAVAPASGLVLLESHTASSSSTLSFNTRNATGQSGNTFQSDYDIYMMELQEFIPATDGARITCQMYTSGAFDSTSGHYAWQAFAMISGGSGANGSTSDTSISLTNGQSNGGNSAWSCTVKLYNPLGTSLRKYLHSEGIGADTSGTRLITFITGGVFTPTTAVTGIQFLCSAGNITSGIARIYGIAK